MNVAEVARAIQAARRDRAHIKLVSSGGPAESGVRTLDISQMEGAVQLDAENLTVSVPAGYSLSLLEAELAEAGLFYPPAYDLTPKGSIGGHIAGATCGPWRLGRGTTRDWVLGLEAVTGEGQIVRTGSGVVKNVAGLDLTKLLIGSRGTLAAITRAILRLAPLPEMRATLSARFRSPVHALDALPELLGTLLSPTAVELHGPDLSVGLEGTALDLPRRQEQAVISLKAAGGWLIAPCALAVPPLEPHKGAMRIRAGLPAGRARPWIDALPGDALVHGHAGSGIYRCVIPANPDLLQRLHAIAADLGGYLTAEAGHGAVAAPRPQALSAVTARVRAVFDPDGVFGAEGIDG